MRVRRRGMSKGSRVAGRDCDATVFLDHSSSDEKINSITSKYLKTMLSLAEVSCR